MTYTAAQRVDAIEVVIEGLSAGTPLAVICRGDGMPSDRSIREWCNDDEQLSDAIASAREAGFDAIAHRLRDTARGSGESTFDVVRDKLIIDTDLKLLAKWDPKRYGDLLKLGNPDGSSLTAVAALEQARARVHGTTQSSD